MKIVGYNLAILQLIIFYNISYEILNSIIYLQKINTISYYWYMFTILTGIWEYYYIMQKKDVRKYALSNILNNKYVWTEKFNIINLLPKRFSLIFYTEYAAYADREYLVLKDDWSDLIEGTHCILCAIFSFAAIANLTINNYNNYLIAAAISMGSQLMNSILYIGEYIIQIQDPHNINYNSNKFPTGFMLIKRPFMYINIFWTIMPIYNIYMLFNNK